MECCKQRKAKVAVPPQHTTRQEDSRLILHVFQTIFWYMRLSGLVVPFTCSHDSHVRNEDAAEEQIPTKPITRMGMLATEQRGASEDPEKDAVRSVNRQLTDTSTDSGLPDPMQAGTGQSQGTNVNGHGGHVFFITDDTFENRNFSLCGNPGFEVGCSNNGATAGIRSCTKQNGTQKTGIKMKRRKRQQVPQSSHTILDVNLIHMDTDEHKTIQGTRSTLPVKQAEPRSYQHMHGIQTQTQSLDAAESHSTRLVSDLESREESRGWAELNRCSKCQVMGLWNRVLCVAVGMLMVFNCLRYFSVFYFMKSNMVYIITFMIFEYFYAAVTLMFTLSSYEMEKQLPHFLETLWKFENSYGLSLDVDNFRRSIETKCRIFLIFQVAFSLSFLMMERFVFPSLRNHLTPFHNSTGVGLHSARIVYTLLQSLSTCFLSFMTGFMAVSTSFVVCEFNKISSDLRKVMAKPGTVLVLSTQDLPLTGGNTSVNSASSADRLDDGGSCSQRSLIQPSMNSNRTSPSVVSSHDGSDSRKDSGNMPHTTGNSNRTSPSVVSSHDGSDSRKDAGNMPHITGNSNTIQHVCPKGYHSQKTQCDFHSSRVHCTMLPKTTDKSSQKSDQRLLDTNEKDDQSSSEDTSPLHQTEFTAAEAETLEASFDILRAKHQMLCELVTQANQCVRHFVSIVFGGSFPLISLIVFVLTSGALETADVLFMSHNLLYTFVFLALVVVLAFRVHDAAHAVQEVIYAADWSQFSDRLLTKVQLFTSRLGHSPIGYDVYGLFVIDRSTVLTVAGTLVTYTVVVIQFQQAEVSPCANTTAPL